MPLSHIAPPAERPAAVQLVVFPESGSGPAPLQTTSLERHPVAVYLAHLSVRSRRVMEAALHGMARLLTQDRCDAWSLPWADVGYAHSQLLRTALVETRHLAPATANQHLAAWRGVLKEAWRLGLMTAEAYARACDVPPVRGQTLPRGRALSPGELQQLFRTCCADGAGPAGVRDAAMLGVLYGSGLRRSELVALDVADYDAVAGSLSVRHGKGNKARLVYLAPGTAEALADWLALRTQAEGALFLPINKGGHVVSRRLSDQAVLYILSRRAEEAGVRAFSPHDMRRTFIGDLLDAGNDMATVQQMAGHASVQTTARYDRRGDATRKRAAGTLCVPYPGRSRSNA